MGVLRGTLFGGTECALVRYLHLEPTLIAVQHPGVQVGLKLGIGPACGSGGNQVEFPGPRVHGNPAMQMMASELQDAVRIIGAGQDIGDVGHFRGVGPRESASLATVLHMDQSCGRSGGLPDGFDGFDEEVLIRPAMIAEGLGRQGGTRKRRVG